MAFVLRGILPPLVTPFRSDGGVDLPAFQANLDAYAAEDLCGYLVLGSNGEAATLEEAEKLELVRAARAKAGGRILLAGTGLESTRATIDLTHRVADLGVDAVLVLTPFYYRSRMTTDALRRHFEAVAEDSPVPVLIYSVPAFTGIPWPPGLAPILAQHPRIAGMKESSGDLALLGQILASVPPSFTVACGSGPVAYPAFCLGAPAAILAVACCAPGPAAALHRAFVSGDHPRARRIQAALGPLAAAVTTVYGVAGLKAAMGLAGLHGGEVRPPLLPVPPAACDELRRLLEEARAAAGL